jgi:uncharacterized integral membrane protein
MRTLTWLLLFAVALFVALVMVLTFMQPPFRQEVGARILSIETRALPVYLYVLGAFLAGLLFGILVLLPGYVRATVEAGRRSRRIRELEQKAVDAENISPVPPEDEKFLPPEDEQEP